MKNIMKLYRRKYYANDYAIKKKYFKILFFLENICMLKLCYYEHIAYENTLRCSFEPK